MNEGNVTEFLWMVSMSSYLCLHYEVIFLWSESASHLSQHLEFQMENMSKHHDLLPNQRYKCNCSIFCIFCHTPYLFVHLQFNILTMVHSINQSRQNNCLTIHMNDRSIQLNSVTVHPNGLFPHLLIISVCDFQFMFFFCVNK